jgi:cytochrome c biogenesis protein CcmG/thiol:disulfide interchange protein DsbE
VLSSDRSAASVFGVALSVAVLVAAVVLAGCSGSSSSGPSSLAPDFSGVTLDGTEVSLAGYQGKPLVLNFMASWCGPCRAEAPDIDQFYRDNIGKVAVLAVAVGDSEEDIRALMADNGWTFPMMLDGDAAADAYGVSAIPTTLVIDSRGHITKRLVGATTAAQLSLLTDGLTR